MKATEKQILYLKFLVKNIFKGQSSFIEQFLIECTNFNSHSAGVMISGLRQELNVRKLPFSMKSSIYSASNMNDFALPKFMNEYNKYTKH